VTGNPKPAHDTRQSLVGASIGGAPTTHTRLVRAVGLHEAVLLKLLPGEHGGGLRKAVIFQIAEDRCKGIVGF